MDDVYLNFQDRVLVRNNGQYSDQVLRYMRSGQPLPFIGKGSAFDIVYPTMQGTQIRAYDESRVPPCEACGAARTFEVQLMPQLVSAFLDIPSSPLKEDKVYELAWSTVWCYFCSSDCFKDGEQSVWREEVVLVQYEED